MSHPPQSAASQWFRAAEAAGDFMGIRFGRLSPESGEVEWSYVSHCDCDGIGGFARLLRQRGATIDHLPPTQNPSRGIIGPMWRLWRSSRQSPQCADRNDWQLGNGPGNEPPTDVAWHLFTEEETQQILNKCRQQQVTVNSLLLKHLDQSVRPEIGRPDARLPWMIPVNIRGDINLADDTENHVSCLDVILAPDDSTHDIQQQIRRRLEHGEHRANFILLELGRFLSLKCKVRYLKHARAKPAGNIGVFSNLGAWDPEKAINTDDAWLFCPPVVFGQLLAAGCVTFQNRLSLTLQAHPSRSNMPEIAGRWMQRWVERIQSA